MNSLTSSEILQADASLPEYQGIATRYTRHVGDIRFESAQKMFDVGEWKNSPNWLAFDFAAYLQNNLIRFLHSLPWFRYNMV